MIGWEASVQRDARTFLTTILRHIGLDRGDLMRFESGNLQVVGVDDGELKTPDDSVEVT